MTTGQWRNGNRFTLLPEAKRYVPAMLAAIDAAQASVAFEQYLMKSGRLADQFIDALCAAARRGVEVRLIIDSLGSHGLGSADRERLAAAGGHLGVFNGLLHGRLTNGMRRDHRKLLLVDHRIAFPGGFCITDDFLEWYDIALHVEGPVVQDWLALFDRLWNSRLLQRASDTSHREIVLRDSIAPVGGAGARGRAIWGRGREYQAIRRSLQDRITSATERVWLCTPYFIPTPSLLRHLMEAARRQVDVRLLLAGAKHDHPSVRYAGQRHYSRLLGAGVRVHEFQATFIHVKYAVIDSWCTIGSCNFDHWSLRWNLEANQEIDDRPFSEALANRFLTDISLSSELTLAAWQQRTWRQRACEWVCGVADSSMSLLR